MSDDFILELPVITTGGDSNISPGDADNGEQDHVKLALARLVRQFQKPRFRAYVKRTVAPIQLLEHILIQVYIARRIDNATGDLLDKFGKLVGQPRLGFDDDNYRRYIRARIRANRSRGTGPDILLVAKLVLDEDEALLELDNTGNASFRLRVKGIIITQQEVQALLSFLRRAVSAGVRFILVTQNASDADSFSYAPFSGPGTGTGKGYGSTLDADVGGRYASANE